MVARTLEWAINSPMLEPVKTNHQVSKSAEPKRLEELVNLLPNWDNQNRIILSDLHLKLQNRQVSWPPRPEEESPHKRRLMEHQRPKIRRRVDWHPQPQLLCATPSSLRTLTSHSIFIISKWGRESWVVKLIQWVWTTPWAEPVQRFQEDHLCQIRTLASLLELIHLQEMVTLPRSVVMVCSSCLVEIDIWCPSMIYTSWN